MPIYQFFYEVDKNENSLKKGIIWHTKKSPGSLLTIQHFWNFSDRLDNTLKPIKT